MKQARHETAMYTLTPMDDEQEKVILWNCNQISSSLYERKGMSPQAQAHTHTRVATIQTFPITLSVNKV